MREPKFRAWDEQKKVMHYDFQFIRSGIEGNDWIVFTSDKHDLKHEPHPFQDAYFAQQLKIMEFTGLKDRQGKEIYEGDFLKDDLGCGEVKWIPEHCAFMIKTDKMYLRLEAGNGVSLTGTEVVGNVYENPELIKE